MEKSMYVVVPPYSPAREPATGDCAVIAAEIERS